MGEFGKRWLIWVDTGSLLSYNNRVSIYSVLHIEMEVT